MSTSGGTRAARAATSRQAKQEVVRLLFGKQYSKTGREGHRLLDYSIYSYADLKKAYLERLQEIHPDKLKQQHQQQTQPSVAVQEEDTRNNRYLHTTTNHFHELQSAWERYDEIAKDMTKAFNKNASGGAADPNFTAFGVGCSFADNEEERALRNEITDQACRGWFSSGALSAGTSAEEEDGNSKTPSPRSSVSLADDDMFAPSDASATPDATTITYVNDTTIKSMSKTLIPGLRIMPRKK